MDKKLVKEFTPETLDSISLIENKPYVIKFGSESCGPCRSMGPILESFAQKNPGLSVYEVDTGMYPELAGHFGIRSIPTIYICEEREVLYTSVGVTSEAKLQYVIDNIDDPYFRENGEFEVPDVRKDYLFRSIIVFLALLFVGALLII